MNPLMVQFISEARELLEKSSQAILDLETHAENSGVINDLFRALHTLKGSSGLFDPEFAALTHLAHAGEDLLGEVREGKLAFTAVMADRLLASVDCLNGWLDAIEQTSTLPSDAEQKGAELAKLLRQEMQKTTPQESWSPPTTPPVASQVAIDLPPAFIHWCRQLSPAEAEATWLYIAYTPDGNAFFFGDDPIYLIRQIASLAALYIAIPANEEGLAAIDPFACQLVFHAICQESPEEMANLFRYVENQVTLTPIQPLVWQVDKNMAIRQAMVIVQEQIEVLKQPSAPQHWQGRLDGVLSVLIHLAALEGEASVQQLQAATSKARAEVATQPLLEYCQTYLQRLQPQTAVVSEAGAQISEKTVASSDGREKEAHARVLKVDQSRIDRLMDLAGELVVAKNAIPYLARQAEKDFGSKRFSRLVLEHYEVMNRLVEELQSSLMQVRMLPVGSIFQRYPRLVRDLSRKLDKEVRLVIEGEQTEADKNIIELLGEPLIHLLRNSLDHGIELPQERVQMGKSPEGEIRLTALQEGDRVVITVADDGKGIDPERVRQKAFAKGIISAEERSTLSNREAIQLIFAPGFSTSEAISDLSGRGVGMDAVRSAVASVGGAVFLESEKGKGSVIRLELPMTMAVTRVMLVEEQGVLYGIPLEQVVETVRIPTASIQPIQDRETTVLRDRILPLFRLNKLLGLHADLAAHHHGDLAVLVIKADGMMLGLVVEAFHKGMDIVLKPMDGILAGLPGYSGAALLGNGRVLLVLDVKVLLPCRSNISKIA